MKEQYNYKNYEGLKENWPELADARTSLLGIWQIGCNTGEKEDAQTQ